MHSIINDYEIQTALMLYAAGILMWIASKRFPDKWPGKTIKKVEDEKNKLR